jgi:hypothetical protein
MRRRIRAIELVGAFYILTASGPAFAATCTERQKVCYAYCEKTYNNAPKCTDACKDYFSQCMSTGCWESKVTAKRCGFDKQ